MNKVYRVVWNKTNNTWVAAAENAKGRTKSTSSATLLAAAMLLGASIGSASAQESVDSPLRNIELNMAVEDEDEGGPERKLRSIMFANTPSGINSDSGLPEGWSPRIGVRGAE